MNSTQIKAKIATEKIIDAIQDDPDLGSEWEMIDQMTREEIKDRLWGIISQEFEKP